MGPTPQHVHRHARVRLGAVVDLDVPVHHRKRRARVGDRGRRRRRHEAWRHRRHCDVIQVEPARVRAQRHLLHAGTKVTVIETVVHFCQPPVAGIDTGTQTLLAPLNPTCIAAPPGDATRTCTVYDPGVRDGDRIVEPLSSRDPADVVTAFRRRFDVDVGVAVLSAGITAGRILIRDAFSAVVEVFRFDRSGNR